MPAGDTLRIWQQIPFYQCYSTYCWPTKIYLYRSELSTTRYKYLSIHKCLTLSNPVSWQNWTAAYLGYTLRMKTLFRGWPIMVNDTHTRRRIHKYKTATSNCKHDITWPGARGSALKNRSVKLGPLLWPKVVQQLTGPEKWLKMWTGQTACDSIVRTMHSIVC